MSDVREVHGVASGASKVIEIGSVRCEVRHGLLHGGDGQTGDVDDRLRWVSPDLQRDVWLASLPAPLGREVVHRRHEHAETMYNGSALSAHDDRVRLSSSLGHGLLWLCRQPGATKSLQLGASRRKCVKTVPQPEEGATLGESGQGCTIHAESAGLAGRDEAPLVAAQ